MLTDSNKQGAIFIFCMCLQVVLPTGSVVVIESSWENYLYFSMYISASDLSKGLGKLYYTFLKPYPPWFKGPKCGVDAIAVSIPRIVWHTCRGI